MFNDLLNNSALNTLYTTHFQWYLTATTKLYTHAQRSNCINCTHPTLLQNMDFTRLIDCMWLCASNAKHGARCQKQWCSLFRLFFHEYIEIIILWSSVFRGTVCLDVLCVQYKIICEIIPGKTIDQHVVIPQCSSCWTWCRQEMSTDNGASQDGVTEFVKNKIQGRYYDKIIHIVSKFMYFLVIYHVRKKKGSC